MRAAAPPSEPGRSSAARARHAFDLAAAVAMACKAWARSSPPAWPVPGAVVFLATVILRPSPSEQPASGGGCRRFVPEANA